MSIPHPATPGPAAAAARLAGAAAVITALTVLSRLAGFGRTAVFLQTVTGRQVELGDIYLVANIVPNIIFELVAGGALASLVVPLVAGAVAAGDRVGVAATASALLTWTLTLLVPLAVLVAVFAGPIYGALAESGAPAAHLALGERMLRVFAPQLPLYGIGIVLTGLLQAHHRFAWPVLAPLLSSVTVIGAYLGFAAVAGRAPAVGQVSRPAELILSLGTTLGVVVLSLCLVPPVRRLGLRLRPRYAFAGQSGRLAVRLGRAGLVTVGAQQVALLVAVKLAGSGPPGTFTVFAFAQTIYLLPWAVLAVPLATAAFPSLSAAHSAGDEPLYRATLARSTRAVLLLSGLGAAALAGLAVPVARLLISATEVDPAAAGITGFAPGLLGYALFALLSRALYARGDTGLAAGAIVAGWAVTALASVALSAALPPTHRVLALTLATSAGMLVLAVLLLAAVRRRAGAAALAGSTRTVGVTVLAAGLATLAGRATVAGLDRLAGDPPTAGFTVLQGMLGGVVVGVAFLAVAYPLNPHELRPMAGSLGRQLHRRARRTPESPAKEVR